MNQIKLITAIAFKGILYLLAKATPKSKSVWVFGAWFGDKYSDNPKVFFEYVNKHCPNIDPIWISSNNLLIDKLRKKGFSAYNMHSLYGIFFQMRASFAFVCQAHDVDLFAPTLSRRTKIVNLWHGLPLKKIIYDEFGHIEIKKNLKGRIIDLLSPYIHMRNDYLIATNQRTQKTLAGAFRLPIEKVLITGFPRNDVFVDTPLTSMINKNPVYKVIYMPTMRKQNNGSNALFEDFNFNIEKISAALNSHNIELTLRLHPINTPPEKLKAKISALNNILFDTSDDIYDTIATYDCLITDYSSIYFDFLLAKKPILFAPFDLANYKLTERELYYEYEEVTLPPYSFDWNELVGNIIKCKTKGMTDDSSHEKLTQMFHQTQINKVFSAQLLGVLRDL